MIGLFSYLVNQKEHLYFSEISCDEPRTPINGLVKLLSEDSGIGSRAEFNCNQGYAFDDGEETEAVCQNDGRWTIELPPPCIGLYDLF